MILASSIASTRFRRMREAVVLKTLGPRGCDCAHLQRGVQRAGPAAGSVGVVFANLLTRVLLRKLEVGFQSMDGDAGCARGNRRAATATGWIASYRFSGASLEVLREE